MELDFHFSDFAFQLGRSEVFMTMFKTKMVGAEEGRVEIHGFSLDIVKGMLEFIYTDKIDIIPKSAWEYLIIGHTYQLDGLKKDAESVIIPCIDSNNSLVICFQGYKYSELLSKTAINYNGLAGMPSSYV